MRKPLTALVEAVGARGTQRTKNTVLWVGKFWNGKAGGKHVWEGGLG